MAVMTGFRETRCSDLHKKGLQAGHLVIGNSVLLRRRFWQSGSRTEPLAGGEVTQITASSTTVAKNFLPAYGS